MMASEDDVRLAYTYAWWLTGDEGSAEQAVLTALSRPEVDGADDQLRVEILLRRVRTASVSAATMCPASELALLHDGMGLSLPSAAGLCEIDARDARTELAHGRLEALTQTDAVDIVEPERLGGLAVGNPPDIAATRQNPQLKELRDAILKGRDELVGITRIPLPDGLLERARAASDARPIRAVPALGEPLTGPTDEAVPDEDAADGTDTAADGADNLHSLDDTDGTGDTDDTDDLDGGDDTGDTGDTEDDARAADADGPAAVDDDRDAPDDLLATIPVETPIPKAARKPRVEPEEVDLSAKVDLSAPGQQTFANRSTVILWSLIGVALLVGVFFLIFAGEDSAFDDDVAGDPVAPAGEDVADQTSEDVASEGVASQDVPADPAAGAGDDPVVELGDGLQVLSFRTAVGLGADAVEGQAQATTADPLSFEIRHSGAAQGDQLVAEWTIDGAEAFPDPEVVDLLDSTDDVRTTRFSRPIPTGGWPAGEHVITLRPANGGEALGSVTVVITPA